jgi:hypothetical protein
VWRKVAEAFLRGGCDLPRLRLLPDGFPRRSEEVLLTFVGEETSTQEGIIEYSSGHYDLIVRWLVRLQAVIVLS